MPQCENYPNDCRGKVQIDADEGKWYCEEHYFKYDRIKEKFIMVGGLKKYLKTSAKDALARRSERASDKARLPPRKPGRP